jgi:hypothetical protein
MSELTGLVYIDGVAVGQAQMRLNIAADEPPPFSMPKSVTCKVKVGLLSRIRLWWFLRRCRADFSPDL